MKPFEPIIDLFSSVLVTNVAVLTVDGAEHADTRTEARGLPGTPLAVAPARRRVVGLDRGLVTADRTRIGAPGDLEAKSVLGGGRLCRRHALDYTKMVEVFEPLYEEKALRASSFFP